MTILFDYDGTIHDTKRLYGNAFRKAYRFLVQEGYAAHRYYADEEVSRYLGFSAPDMWRDFMPELPHEVMEQASTIIGQELIAGVENGQAVLYDGIPSVLTLLREQGYSLMVLSNCREAYMEAHRYALKLDRWFCDYFCGETYGFAPKEEIFDRIAKKYPDTSFLMIGDRASDIEVGRVHRLPSIGCLYGFGSPEELRNAVLTVQTPSELPEAIRKIMNLSVSH